MKEQQELFNLLNAAQFMLNRLETLGEWDEGCYYYQGRSAPELQPAIQLLTDAVIMARKAG